MFGLNEAIDRLTMANRVHWCGHMLCREDNSLENGIVAEVQGQTRNEKTADMKKK